MTDGVGFRPDHLVAHIPYLRAYARALCRDRDRADDLVQDTLLAAWDKRTMLRDPERLRSWLFQILRNAHLMAIRRSAREVSLRGDCDIETLTTMTESSSLAMCGDIDIALAQLDPSARDAIILVGVQELTYEQAAVIAECSVGAMKNRVSRARKCLRDLLGHSSPTQDAPVTPGRAADIRLPNEWTSAGPVPGVLAAS